MKTLLAFLAVALAVVLVRGHHYYIHRTQDLKRGWPEDWFGREHLVPEYIIFNGYEAAEGSVPYIVGLAFRNAIGPFRCGGSIIGDSWILTAAHCFTLMDSVQIFYGYNLYGISEISHTVGKKNFISHEQYGHSGPGPFDIGLIRTPNRIEFSAKISKIALPKLSDQSDSMVGWNTKSCGWGSTTETVYPYHLQCMDVNVISNGECFKLFSHFNDFKNITDDMVCTGLIKGKAVCGGDSGGPLVTRSNPPTLVGVVSFGSEACDAASVYARVSYFLKWIHEKTDIPILS